MRSVSFRYQFGRHANALAAAQIYVHCDTIAIRAAACAATLSPVPHPAGTQSSACIYAIRIHIYIDVRSCSREGWPTVSRRV